MKLLIAAILATLMATAAAAQTNTAPPTPTSTCADLPATPTLPDGGTANNEAMTRGQAVYMAWATPVQQSLACRRAEIDALQARWEALVRDYNGAAQTLNAQRAVWDNEIEQYNARGGGRQRSANNSAPGH